jgi:phosphoglycerate dehydrogenase-like enzyme
VAREVLGGQAAGEAGRAEEDDVEVTGTVGIVGVVGLGVIGSRHGHMLAGVPKRAAT